MSRYGGTSILSRFSSDATAQRTNKKGETSKASKVWGLPHDGHTFSGVTTRQDESVLYQGVA